MAANWRWNLTTILSDIFTPVPPFFAGFNLEEVPASGSTVDLTVTVPFGGAALGLWTTPPREPNEGDVDEWTLGEAPGQPFLSFEVVVPNVEITIEVDVARVRHDGTLVELYATRFPLVPQVLGLAQTYMIFNNIPGTQEVLPVLPSDRIRMLWLLRRSIAKGSEDITFRFGNNADTFLEVELDRKFPIMRNTAAAAAVVQRTAAPRAVNVRQGSAVVVSTKKGGVA